MGAQTFAFPVAVVLAVAPVAHADERPVVGPAPAWVEPLADDEIGASQTPDAAGALDYIVVDRQWCVDGGESEDHQRFVERIRTAEGLASASQLTLDWDPSYQRLTIHTITIRRDGQTLSRLRPDRIQVLRRETGLEDRLYDGTLSASIVIDDLRVGDVLDYSFTRAGSSPVLQGKESRSFSLSWSIPVRVARVRVLWPEHRRLFTRTFGDAPRERQRRLGRFVERVWQRADVPAVVSEDYEPAGFEPFARVQLSEDETWADVVRWALPLYPASRPLGGPLGRRLQELRTEALSEDQKIAAALSIAQRDVRYIGIELGESSHKPTQPEAVYERRFGDCKDKALLAVALLRGLGLDAWPALVNTWERAALDRWQPSRLAFNHVIVAVRTGDAILWLDPSLPQQDGKPSRFRPPPFRRALLLRQGEDTLTEIPLPPLPTPLMTVEEHWVLQSDARSATRDITTQFRDSAADNMRRTLATTSREELSKRWCNYYAAYHPTIRERSTFGVADDPVENTLTVTEHYGIPEAWQLAADGTNETALFRAGAVLDVLRFPSVRQRLHPLALDYPVNVEQRIRVDLPDGFRIPAAAADVERPELWFHYSVEPRGKRLELHYRLRTTADVVAPGDVAAHLEALGQIERAAEYSLTRAPTGDAGARTMNWPLAVLAAMGLAAFATAACIYYRRAPRGLPPAPLHPDAPSGFGGWLLLLGFGVLLSPVRLARDLWLIAPSYALESWTHYTSPQSAGYAAGAAPYFIGEMLANLALLVLSLLLVAVMLRKRHDFPRVFLVFATANFVLLLVDSLVGDLVLEASVTDTTSVSQAALWGFIWGMYVLKSRRVKATFTN